MTAQPYAVLRNGDWFTVIDTRTNASVSYPTGNKRQAQQERKTMNRAYAEATAVLTASAAS